MESGQDEDCGFHCRDAGAGVETDNDVVDGEIRTMTKDDHFFVRGVRQPF